MNRVTTEFFGGLSLMLALCVIFFLTQVISDALTSEGAKKDHLGVNQMVDGH